MRHVPGKLHVTAIGDLISLHSIGPFNGGIAFGSWVPNELGIYAVAESDSIVHALAFYGQGNYQLAENVNLTFGLRWSEDPKRIETYIRNGREMKDVLGISFGKAIGQLPDEEADDAVWPYNA